MKRNCSPDGALKGIDNLSRQPGMGIKPKGDKWAISGDLLINTAETRVLSNGLTLREQVSTLSTEASGKKLDEAKKTREDPFEVYIATELRQNSELLEEKKALLERISETPDKISEQEGSFLGDFVRGLGIRIEYLSLLDSNGDFSSAIAVLRDTKGSLGSTIGEVDARRYVLDSLLKDLQRESRKKNKLRGWLQNTVEKVKRTKRRELTNTYDEKGTPLVSSRPITKAAAQQVPISTVTELLKICDTTEERECISIAAGLLGESNGDSFVELFCFCYGISENDPYLDEKTSAIVVIGSAVMRKYGLNAQDLYSSEIDRYIEDSLTEDDIMQESVAGNERSYYKRIVGIARRVENMSESSDRDMILDAALAYWELELNRNDEFLNSESVLDSIVRAKFFDQPLTVRFIRSLRWCYPNREVEIPPTVSDWETLDTEGKRLLRKESVEKEKLEIFRAKVLRPLVRWGIPVQEVTLLLTGDYEMTGPGYEFEESDPRCVNARLYVNDLRQRLGTWGIFSDLPFGCDVITIKEYIQEKRASFDSMAMRISQNIDALFSVGKDAISSYCGYTYQGMEFIFEREDGNRTPFISWWTWRRTQAFTKYKTWFEMTVGWFISKYDKNTIIIVSGNRASGLPLSKSKSVDPKTITVGIVPIRLVNDGQISKDFASKTTVT